MLKLCRTKTGSLCFAQTHTHTQGHPVRFIVLLKKEGSQDSAAAAACPAQPPVHEPACDFMTLSPCLTGKSETAAYSLSLPWVYRRNTTNLALPQPGPMRAWLSSKHGRIAYPYTLLILGDIDRQAGLAAFVLRALCPCRWTGSSTPTTNPPLRDGYVDD